MYAGIILLPPLQRNKCNDSITSFHFPQKLRWYLLHRKIRFAHFLENRTIFNFDYKVAISIQTFQGENFACLICRKKGKPCTSCVYSYVIQHSNTTQEIQSPVFFHLSGFYFFQSVNNWQFNKHSRSSWSTTNGTYFN